MKHTLLLIYTFLLLAPSLLPAQAVVEFPAKTIDIGTVYEDADSVNCTFEVVNKGDAPLLIQGVHLKCGCVKATYSKDSIMPGMRGYVTATLFPKGYPGRFIKSIYIYTNTIPRKNILRLKAFISEPPEKQELRQ